MIVFSFGRSGKQADSQNLFLFPLYTTLKKLRYLASCPKHIKESTFEEEKGG